MQPECRSQAEWNMCTTGVTLETLAIWYTASERKVASV